MNALVGIRSNTQGWMTPTPQKRVATAQQISSLGRAALLGKMLGAKAVQEDAAATAAGSATAPTAATDSNSLDKDSFLQLLVNQMRYQDPLEPASNEQMLSQLAQFSSLEQMSNLNKSFETLSGNIDQLNFINASAMIGRTVTGVDTDGNAITGKVERIQMDKSIVYLTVGGKLMSMAGVAGVQ